LFTAIPLDALPAHWHYFISSYLLSCKSQMKRGCSLQRDILLPFRLLALLRFGGCIYYWKDVIK
jgi:hypothetical protein